MKIGIFGGSFDPIHIGHLIMADSFYHQYNLDKLLFIPSYQSPLKNVEKRISNNQILELINLSISYNENYLVEDYEIKKEGVSYSIDTINYLSSKYDAEFYLLIGDDQFLQFRKWKEWETLLQKVHLVVARRDNFNYDEMINVAEYYTKMGFEINFLEAPFIEISSTFIRNCIRENAQFKNLVPEKAYQKIIEQKLYR